MHIFHLQQKAAYIVEKILNRMKSEVSPASKYDFYGLSLFILLDIHNNIHVYLLDFDKAENVGFEEAAKDRVGTRAGLQNIIDLFRDDNMSNWNLVTEPRTIYQGIRIVQERYGEGPLALVTVV